MEYNLDLATFFPFNFHKIEAVRYGYNKLISMYLAQPKTSLNCHDLCILHTLVVQSIAMETTPRIVKLLLKVLALIVTKFETYETLDKSPYAEYIQLDLLQDQKLPAWLFDVSV